MKLAGFKYSLGFSVLEVLVVIFIVGILFMQLIPVTSQLAGLNESKLETQILKASMHELLAHAISYEREINLTIGPKTYRAFEPDTGHEIFKHSVPNKISMNSTPHIFRFYPSGITSPGHIQIKSQNDQCALIVSLRARLRMIC